MLAGPEGFLMGREWRGLDQREVVWGDMVSILPIQVPVRKYNVNY
jgi:hypothetical protein